MTAARTRLVKGLLRSFKMRTIRQTFSSQRSLDICELDIKRAIGKEIKELNKYDISQLYLKEALSDQGFSMKVSEDARHIELTKIANKTLLRIVYQVQATSARGEDLIEDEPATLEDRKSAVPFVFFVILDKGGPQKLLTDVVVTDESQVSFNGIYLTSDPDAIIEKYYSFKDHKSYIGPLFEEMSSELQDAFEEYFNAFGIGSELAMLIHESCDFFINEQYKDFLTRLLEFYGVSPAPVSREVN